jgi:hypothetical protein
MKLIDNVGAELRRLWSVRVAAFWSLVCGLILIWPGLAGEIPTWLYALGGIVISVSFGVARVLKQPGTEQ